MKKLSLILALALLLASFVFAEKSKGKKIGSGSNGCRAVCENDVLNIYDNNGDVLLECKKKDFKNREQQVQFKKTVETCANGKYIKHKISKPKKK